MNKRRVLPLLLLCAAVSGGCETLRDSPPPAPPQVVTVGPPRLPPPPPEAMVPVDVNFRDELLRLFSPSETEQTSSSTGSGSAKPR